MANNEEEAEDKRQNLRSKKKPEIEEDDWAKLEEPQPIQKEEPQVIQKEEKKEEIHDEEEEQEEVGEDIYHNNFKIDISQVHPRMTEFNSVVKEYVNISDSKKNKAFKLDDDDPKMLTNLRATYPSAKNEDKLVGKKTEFKNLISESIEIGNKNQDSPAKFESKKSMGPADDFVKRAIKQHNKYRDLHGAPPLREDPQITEMAQKYATYLAENNMFQNSGYTYKGQELGENIYYGTKLSAEEMIDNWYNENKDYDYAEPEKDLDKTGNFTQIVWKNTTHVGIGIAKSKEGYYFGVANYYPPGNISGDFDLNVSPEQ